MSLTGSVQGVMRFIQNHTEPDLTRVHEHGAVLGDSVFACLRPNFLGSRGSINGNAFVYTFWVHNVTLVVGDLARWKRAHLCENVADAIVSNWRFQMTGETNDSSWRQVQ
jgi:hypothetical protein